MPKISLVVPVYKTEEFLPRCIESVLAQTFEDFELILVDDGSPDNCGVICDDYAEKDGRVHVIHQINSGVSAARNAAIDWAIYNSDSKWIGFIDSDDWVHIRFLEILFRSAEESHTQISTCGYRVIQSTDACSIKDEIINGVYATVTPDAAFTNNGTTICSYVWRSLYCKKLWENVRFPLGEIWEDVSTVYRVIFSTDKIAAVSDELYYYFQHARSITNSAWSPKNIDSILAMERMLNDPILDSHPSVLSIVQEKYVYALSNQIIQSSEYPDLPQKQLDQIRGTMINKLRHALWQYKANEAIKFKNCKWCFEAAYPLVIRIYWALFSKMQKKKDDYDKA